MEVLAVYLGAIKNFVPKNPTTPNTTQSKIINLICFKITRATSRRSITSSSSSTLATFI